jgi:hypothetical protein
MARLTLIQIMLYLLRGGAGTFINKPGGIINKTGLSTMETSFTGNGGIGSTFINDGTINVNSGRIRINPAGSWNIISFTSNGKIKVKSEAAMSFSGNTAIFTAESTFSGAGTADFSGAIAAFNGSASLTTKSINVSGGSITVDNAGTVATTNITLSGGTFTLNPSLTLGAGGTLIVSGGILSGGSTLTIPSGCTFRWDGGTLGGSGTLNLDTGGTYTINYGFGWGHYLAETRTINNYGTLTWNSSHWNYQSGAPVINNYGTFNINTDDDIGVQGGLAIFNNKFGSIINKTSLSNGETFFTGNAATSGTFINDGTINVNSGSLTFNPAWSWTTISFTSNGNINVDSGAVMSFGGNWATFTAGSTFNGAGTADFSGAIATFNNAASLTTTTINVSDGSLYVATAATIAVTNITVSSGTFTLNPSITLGAGGTLTINGGLYPGIFNGASTLIMPSGTTFNWTGGTLGGSGTLNLNYGVTATIGGGEEQPQTVVLADTRTVNNYSTLTWIGDTLFYGAVSPAFYNYGFFNISTDYVIYGGTGTFINKQGGVLNKIGYSGTFVEGLAEFANEGTININSSKISVGSKFTHNGSINIALGALICFTRDTANFNAGSTIGGLGTINIEGDKVQVNINESASFSPATVNILIGTLAITPALSFNSGTTFNLSGGNLINYSTLDLESGCKFNWTAGTLGGNGILNLYQGTLSTVNFNYDIVPIALVLTDSKTINNYGVFTWGTGNLFYRTNPTINNFGTFNIYTDADFSYQEGTGTFANKDGGIINKIGTPFEETQFVGNGGAGGTFINDGTINVNSGILTINPSWSWNIISFTSNGKINVASGAAVNFGGNTATFTSGSTFTGEGTVDFSGAVAIFNGSASLTTKNINVSAGTITVDNAGTVATTNITVSGGTFTLNPSLTLGAGGSLIVSGGVFNGASTLTIPSGCTFSWDGGTLGGSGTLNLDTGGTYTINYGFGWAHLLADTRTINNHGILTWLSSILQYQGTNPTFNNYGTFNINTDDDIGFPGGTGTFSNKPGGIINKTGFVSDETSFNYGTTAIFNNMGTVNVNTGNLALYTGGIHTGDYNISNGSELRGTIDMLFSGTSFTNNGKVMLTGLTFSGTSVQELNGTGTINILSINNSNGVTLGGTQTVNTTLNLTTGKLTLGNNDLVMAGSAAFSGGSASSYIVTDGTGSLARKVLMSNVSFPVGHSTSYMPANIQMTSGSDTFKVRVLPSIYNSYDGSNNPIGIPLASNSVNATWIISKSTAGGSATVAVQWNGSDETSGFNRASSRFGHYISGAWNFDAVLAASGSNPYTSTSSGIESFGPVGITNQLITCTNIYSPLCAGSSVNVPYNAVGMNAGNKFTAQLSDAAGSFSPPLNIGTLNSASSGTINATIPAGTLAGTGYRIRVKSNDPAFTSIDNGSNISIGIYKKYFQDSDGDAYGNHAVSQLSCSIPTGYVLDSTDCSDANATIHPNASEICNSLDDDCDSKTDEDVKLTFYADADSDGYGNPNVTKSKCVAPAGYVSNNTDCNDGNASVNFGASEVCNGLDDNCDGIMDEITAIYKYTDNTLGIPYSFSTNAIATNLSRINGATAPSFPCANGGFSSKGFTNAVTFSKALPAIEFTITPIQGYQINVASFSADLRQSLTGPELVRYAYSTNGGTIWIDQGGDNSLEYTACGTMVTYSWDVPDFTTNQVLKFRIYGYNASSVSGTLQILNIELDGQVCSATIDADGDGYNALIDCNDNNAVVHPGAPDICNDIDDDCDQLIDENALASTVTPTGSVATCTGISITLTANSGSGITYQWIKNGANVTGATNSTYSTSKAGSYQVTEGNNFNCISTSPTTTISVNSNPIATITPLGDLDICSTGSVVLQANAGTGLTYQWKKGDNIIAGATNQTYTATQAKKYKVIVTNSNGCSKTSSSITVINSCKLTEDFETSTNGDLLKVYPNPTGGKFTLEMKLNIDANSYAKIEIMNLIGQKVYSKTVQVSEGELEDEITLNQNLPDGMYLVKVIIKDKVATSRIVYQK